MNRLLSTAFVAALLIAGNASAHAQSADEMIARIQAQANELNRFRELLNSPDQSVRIAAFRAMADSDNADYRELAINTGLVSSDVTLQGLALAEAFKDLGTISLVYDYPADADRELLARVIQYNGNQFSEEIRPKTNNLSEPIPGEYTIRNECDVTVAGVSVVFSCRTQGDGVLSLTGQGVLSGVLELQGGNSSQRLRAQTTVRVR